MSHMATIRHDWAPKTLEAWRFVQQVLAEVTQTVADDASDERELLDGLRVIAKVTGLCTELTVQADTERPHFFDMCSDTRMVGGPNPGGRTAGGQPRGRAMDTDPARRVIDCGVRVYRRPGHRRTRYHEQRVGRHR